MLRNPFRFYSPHILIAPRTIAVCVLVLALCAAPTASQGQLGKPEGLYYKSWGLVIGIDEYLVAPPLPGAVKNAKQVAETLRKLDFDEVVEVYNKKASSKNLHHILDDVLTRKLGRADRLVIYFAGHAGETMDLNGHPLGYLVPWDAQVQGATKAVSLDQLKEVGHRVMAKHVLLLLDAEVSGWDVTPSQQLSLEGRTTPEQDTDKRVLQVLSARKFGEPSGWVDGHSPFVGAVTEGLSGAADLNNNGWLMASELGRFVKDTIEARSNGAQHPQYARLDGDGDTVMIEGKPSDFAMGPKPTSQEEKAAAAKHQYDEAFKLLQTQQSPDEALARLDKALALDPTLGDAYVLKSYVHLEIRPSLDDALSEAQLAVKYAPNNPDSHYTLGLVQEKRRAFTQAEAAFLNAVKANPEYADVYLSLGMLYEDSLNDNEKAAGAYKRYQELGGTNSRATLFFRKQAASPPAP